MEDQFNAVVYNLQWISKIRKLFIGVSRVTSARIQGSHKAGQPGSGGKVLKALSEVPQVQLYSQIYQHKSDKNTLNSAN